MTGQVFFGNNTLVIEELWGRVLGVMFVGHDIDHGVDGSGSDFPEQSTGGNHAWKWSIGRDGLQFVINADEQVIEFRSKVNSIGLCKFRATKEGRFIDIGQDVVAFI